MAWTTPSTAVAGSTALTAAFWNEQVRDNLNALYDSARLIDSRTQATSYTVDQTAIGSASDVFATDITFTALAATYIVEFFCVSAQVGAGLSAINVHLTDGGSNILAQLAQFENNNSQYYRTQIYVRQRVTFATAGSKSINVRAVKINANGFLFSSGSGFPDAPLQLYLYGPDIT